MSKEYDRAVRKTADEIGDVLGVTDWQKLMRVERILKESFREVPPATKRKKAAKK